MIWYTPQFRATFSSEEEMDLFIDQIFAETNQGYINSQIPVSVIGQVQTSSSHKCDFVSLNKTMLQVTAVKHHVKQHPNLTDIDDSSAMLSAFADSMSSSDLLNCADSAALLIEDFSSCGIAFLNTAFSCRAISVTKKSCATGYYRCTSFHGTNSTLYQNYIYFSFGHEIGHNFGSNHNPEQYSSTSGDGYGHLIKVRNCQKKIQQGN